MFVAYNDSGERVLAQKDMIIREPLHCACGAEVIYKNCNSVRSHFAHKAGQCTAIGNHADMSEWHADWQGEGFSLRGGNDETSQCKLEFRYTLNGITRIVDLATFDSKGNPEYSYEFQHSPIKPEEIRRRCLLDIMKGFKPIWLFDVSVFGEAKFKNWRTKFERIALPVIWAYGYLTAPRTEEYATLYKFSLCAHYDEGFCHFYGDWEDKIEVDFNYADVLFTCDELLLDGGLKQIFNQ